MGSDSIFKVLLVAEGSGGHLIPALQVAGVLAKAGARTKVWYAERPQTARLAGALAHEAEGESVEVQPIPAASPHVLGRLWQCGQLWSRAQRCFETFAPDVVVGFGGWLSAPIVLAAKKRRIRCVVHEQNVVLGRANRWLSRWVDRLAVSFQETPRPRGAAPRVVTGMPVRNAIGASSRDREAQAFGFTAQRPTLLILGGSQGAQAINRLMAGALTLLSGQERRLWQFLHVTGHADEAAMRAAYGAAGVTAWVAPFLMEMASAYSLADLVIGRAGASTIAELARCGTPAVLIPYPHAGGHQLANARHVEAVGGGLLFEEAQATPKRLLGAVRRVMADRRLRTIMGEQMQGLDSSDATERLAEVIRDMAHASR